MQDVKGALEELRAVAGDRLTTSASVRAQHGRDESPLPPAAPDAVVFPRSSAEIAAILKVCTRRGVPVIPFGAGTSLEGHVLATAGGISLDTSHMNEIVAVNVDDLDVTVQAGVTRKQLNERLARDGLFFPVDPGADATLGGMAATNASGTTTVKYGAMRENVLSLEVVLPDGRIIRTARRARKSAAGYDLTRLFVGSEGTLGVITEVTLRLHGIPEVIAGALCHFSDIEGAVQSVIEVLQSGVDVARIEYLDGAAMAASNAYSQLHYAEAPTLLLEFHGSPAVVDEQQSQVGEIVRDHGALAYQSTMDNRERTELFRARHDSFYASLALRPGAKAITTDVCVPISRLAECLIYTARDIEEQALVTTMVGHVGDGNFHVVILVDPDDATERDRAEAFNHRLVRRALGMDGTCTGEHGIGLRKKAFLREELPEAIGVMGEIKKTLDPQNIMNPGKLLG